MEIFEKLKIHADRKGLSNTEIGKMSGKSSQSISNYFSGKNQIPLDWLCWYLDSNPDIDVQKLFNRKIESYITVEEQRPKYPKVYNKQRLLEKIGNVLDEEL